LGLFAYDEAFALQRETVERLQEGRGAEALFLLEHPHVITLGRNASTSSLIAGEALLRARGVALVETDRGGDVTYHGPGQLVGYPILRLDPGRRDIRRFVTNIEETLLRTLTEFGIEGRRDAVHRGVWVGERKIASVGIRISRWVTSHGVALNVATDLSYFSLIHPCGIAGCEMTSMSQELGVDVDMRAVKVTLSKKFGEVFDRAIVFETPLEEARLHGAA
jgi:lipoyl(octanoyl) transferase